MFELDNESPTVSLNKGDLFRSIKLDNEISEALDSNNKTDIKFVVKSSEISDETKKLVNENMKSDEEIAFNIAASIKLYIDDIYVKDINEATSAVTFKINIPKEFIKRGRVFSIIRTHENSDGTVTSERLEDKDSSDDTITITSDKFSDFTIVYSDKGITDKNADGTVEVNNSKINNPNTYDNILKNVITFVISIMGIVIVLVPKKLTKEK